MKCQWAMFLISLNNGIGFVDVGTLFLRLYHSKTDQAIWLFSSYVIHISSPSYKCTEIILAHFKMVTITEIKHALKIIFLNVYMFRIGQQRICEANCYSVW